MNAAIYLAYTTKILLGNLRDMHSSSVACRTEVVVRHAFISENDDERHIIITFIMFLGANGYLRIGINLN